MKYSLAFLLSRYAKLLSPIAQLVVLLHIGSFVVSPAGLLQVIGHTESVPKSAFDPKDKETLFVPPIRAG